MRSSWPTRPIASPRSPEVAMPRHHDAARTRHSTKAPDPAAAADPFGNRAVASAPVVVEHVDEDAGSDGTPDGVRLVEARLVPIQQATDLGSVQVLKHGNL